MSGRSDRLDTLEEIQPAVWHELQAAARDRAHPWRTPVLATRDGDSADARVLVLREVDAAARQLLCFTDARSPKRAQVEAAPVGTLVMWSPARGWQLRLRVRVTIQTDGLAVTSRWAQLRHTRAAQDYLAPLAPGQRCVPTGAAQGTGTPQPALVREARHHFALLTAEVMAMDWLELHPLGHRRARFDADGGHWLTP